jgi:hypothetical protein
MCFFLKKEAKNFATWRIRFGATNSSKAQEFFGSFSRKLISS